MDYDPTLRPIKLNAEESAALLERMDAVDAGIETLSDEDFATLMAQRRAEGERALAMIRRRKPKRTAAA